MGGAVPISWFVMHFPRLIWMGVRYANQVVDSSNSVSCLEDRSELAVAFSKLNYFTSVVARQQLCWLSVPSLLEQSMPPESTQRLNEATINFSAILCTKSFQRCMNPALSHAKVLQEALQ